MKTGIYKLTKKVDGNGVGTEVEITSEYEGKTSEGKTYAICNPLGEPDMQSSMVIFAEEVEFVR